MNAAVPSTFVLIVACVLRVASANTANEPNASSEKARHIRQKAEGLMRDWKTVPVAVLRDPANADAVQQLRTEARAPHRSDARVPLLRSGDPEIIAQCVTEFRTKKSGRRNAAEQLKLSGNPAIIALVADELFRAESTEAEWITPELRERPVSVHACDIIRGIVSSSAAFNQPAKLWGASLSTKSSDREAVRAEMRQWWRENEDRIKTGHYSQVRPPNRAFSGSP